MNSSHKYALAVVSNKDFLEYTKQVFYTAKRYGNWDGDFLLLAYDIDDSEPLSWFVNRNINIIKLNENSISLPNISDKERVYYAKLYLFHPQLAKYEKILYMDTDMIVKRDIRLLLDYDDFAAADDSYKIKLLYQFTSAGTPMEKSAIASLIPHNVLNKVSFNTGLMLIPSGNNTQEEFNQLLFLANKYGKYSIFYEQGIINLLFINKRKRIPAIYNDFYSYKDLNYHSFFSHYAKRDAVIIHCIYPYKPWNKLNSYHNEWKKNLELANQEWLFEKQGKKVSAFIVWRADMYLNLSIDLMQIKWKWRYKFQRILKILRTNNKPNEKN